MVLGTDGCGCGQVPAVGAKAGGMISAGMEREGYRGLLCFSMEFLAFGPRILPARPCGSKWQKYSDIILRYLYR